MRRLTIIIVWIATFCSITGFTVWAFVKEIILPHPDYIPYMALVVGIFGVISLGVILHQKLRELEGTVVSRQDRSTVSQSFAIPTLRSIDIFAGDLSWFLEDIEVYKNLRNRGVRIRVLTDTPEAIAIQEGKKYGIEFKQYPNGMSAPIKASITDTDDETECRALVVRRRTPRRRVRQGESYEYWMKFYHGSKEYPIIKAMALLFEKLWEKGRPL